MTTPALVPVPCGCSVSLEDALCGGTLTCECGEQWRIHLVGGTWEIAQIPRPSVGRWAVLDITGRVAIQRPTRRDAERAIVRFDATGPRPPYRLAEMAEPDDAEQT